MKTIPNEDVGNEMMTTFGDTVTPGDLNKWMIKQSKDSGGYKGSSVNWDAISLHNNSNIVFESNLETRRNFPNKLLSSNVSKIDQSLENCEVVIVKVVNPKNREHWILITGKKNGEYLIHDPGYRKTKLSEYGNAFWDFHIVRRKK